MRGLIVAGLTFLLAACAGPLVATPSGSPGAAAPAPASTPATTAPTPIPTPTPASGAADGAWTTLRWEAPPLMAPFETVSDVVAYGGGYVAVGQLQTEHGNEAAAWISQDWRTWTRTLLDAPAAGDSTFWHVLPAGSGLVAIGSSGALHCVPPDGEGQVCDPLPIGLWTSADGRAWRQTPTPAVLAGASIASVAAGPTGLVLVGDSGWDEPGIWTSTDGLAWHRETMAPAVFAKAHFLGITAAHGGWVLTGFTGGSKPVCCAAGQSFTTPAAWFSADGTDWQVARVDGAKQAVGDGIGRVFVGRDGLVAWGVGSGSSGWTSPDGRRWSPRPTSDVYPVGPSASDGQRILGESYVSHNRLAFWVSTDGVAWQPLAVTGAVDQMPGWPGAAAWTDAAFVFSTGVGFIGQNGTDRFPLWFAEAEGPSDAATARSLVERFEAASAAGDRAGAWSLLATWSQRQFPSIESFADSRRVAFAGTASAYVIGEPRSDDPSVPGWLAKSDPGVSDPGRVFSVEVTHPNASPAAVRLEVFFVALDASGAWKIWILN